MKVLLGEAAKVELENAIEWYELQNEGLGGRFGQAIDITGSHRKPMYWEKRIK